MTKEQLIRTCRYYKGQDGNPYLNMEGNMAWFGDMERVYVNSGGNFKGEASYYKAINGKMYPGIPFSLLMVMFTSWGKWTSGIKENIEDFYKTIDDYLFIPNDHIPEDKIPLGD